MPPITSNISSLSATPYVDAFTTGEILGFVVMIICTQIVITWIAVRSIRRCIVKATKLLIEGNAEMLTGVSHILIDEINNFI